MDLNPCQPRRFGGEGLDQSFCFRRMEMANHALDLTGKKFGKLTVVGIAHRDCGVHWHCTCDCGGKKVVHGPSLKSGQVKSCGCLVSEVMADKALDIEGVRFGRLVAVRATSNRRGHCVEWECVCDCGKIHYVGTDKLRSGSTNSCGCLRLEIHTTHGMSQSPEYHAWSRMKARCSNPLDNRWETHGARGILVCERWLESFENFYADMGARPAPSLSLERKDNDGNYTPENCVWATSREQADNRRTTLKIEIEGRVQSLKAWCRELSLPYLRTWKRLYKSGWTIERALQP